jgi:pantetheine-phosphate adenylyltransferase
MTAMYTGSFDPVTRGHIDIARRAARLADILIVALPDNPNKQPLFSRGERISFLQDALSGIPNVQITAVRGMLASFVREKNINMIVRGVRNAADFEYETQMAHYNKLLTRGVDTVLLPAEAAHRHISCSAVKEIARLVYACEKGCEEAVLLTMVTEAVRDALKARILKGDAS